MTELCPACGSEFIYEGLCRCGRRYQSHEGGPVIEVKQVDEQLSEHFTRSQLACPCCGQCDLDERLLPALEKLRRLAKAEIEIVSGYRCEKTNRDVMGVSKSAHIQGRAADIRIAGMTLQHMYDLAEKVPEFENGGIGVNDDGTLHVDLRVFKARWGRVNGKYLGIEGSKLLARW